MVAAGAENGQLSPWLLVDPDNVDEYRRSVGLDPLAERIEQARSGTGKKPKPSDFKKRQEEMEAWAKSVGWL